MTSAGGPTRPAAGPAAPPPVSGVTASRPASGLGTAPPRQAPAPPKPVAHRSWAEIRWRQFRNAPRPVVRAVLASLTVAVVLAAAYVLYDIALSRGAQLPGGDLRVLAVALYVVLVLAIGSAVTYVVVPQPAGANTVQRRSVWSAALGFFAAVPIAYLVIVAAVQIIRPLFG